MKTRITHIIIYSLVSLMISCNTQQIKNLAPIKVAKNQYIYHYTKQKDLDTLPYRFRLKNNKRSQGFYLELTNSNYKDTTKEIWSTEKIKNFERSIERLPFKDISLRESMKYDGLFSEYCQQGEMKDRLKTVKLFSEKAGDNGNDVLVSITNKTRAPFDYFMLYGNDSIKQEATKMMLERIPRISAYDFRGYIPLLINEKSEAYYNALSQLQKNIDTITSDRKREFYLSVARDDITHEMARVAKKEPSQYQSDLDSLVSKAQIAGLLQGELSVNQHYQLARDYTDSYHIKTIDFLKNINVIFTYKSTHYAMGHLATYSTPPYTEMMEKYMIAAITDIPDFYTDTYLYRDHTGKPNYALFLGNEKEGFVIKITDTKSADFDHAAVSLLFNTVLKYKNINKRFTYKKNDDEHRHEVVYAAPNSLKSFLTAVGTSLSELEAELSKLRY